MRLLSWEGSGALVADFRCATSTFEGWCKSRIYPGARTDAQIGFENSLTGKVYQDTMPISCNHVVLKTRVLIGVLDSDLSRKLRQLLFSLEPAAVSGRLYFIFTQDNLNAWKNLLGPREHAKEGMI